MALSHNPRIVTDGLVLCLDAANPKSYPGSGTTWYDLSGNGNHCSWSFAPTFNSDSNYNNVKYFTTLGNYCIGPPSNSFGIDNSSGYTIIHIFRQISLVSSGGFHFLSSNGSSGESSRGIFAHSTWGNERYYFDQGGCCASSQRTSYLFSGLTTNKYNMYCVTSSVSNRKIYFNGNLSIENTSTAADINLDSRNVYVSGSPDYGSSGSSWNARLSVFHVYNRELSNSEVLQNYNALKGRFL